MAKSHHASSLLTGIIAIFERVRKATTLKDHYLETILAALILITTALISKKGWVEWVGVMGVIITFEYQVLSTYLSEHSEARAKHKRIVKSDLIHKEIRILYFGKEAIWLIYFLALGAYSGLVGTIIFITYGFWRKKYREQIPLQKRDVL